MTIYETYAAIFVMATGIYLVVYAIGNSIKPEIKLSGEKAPGQIRYRVKSTSHSCNSCGAKSATNHKCDYCGNEIVESLGIIQNKIPLTRSERERIEREFFSSTENALRKFIIPTPTKDCCQIINE